MSYIKIFILINLMVFLSSCGTVKKAFSNQKKNGSDEFLVQKKSPLVMPPNYNELPTPKLNENQNNRTDIKKLITKSENISNTKDNTDDSSKNIEQTILKKIKEN